MGCGSNPMHGLAIKATSIPLDTTMTYHTYRITFRTGTGKERELPVMSDCALNAVKSLEQLGYDVTKFRRAFPSV